MKMHTAIVSYTEIDVADKRFVVSFGRDSSALADSIKKAGLITPPCLVFAPSKGRYRVVCGYLRLKALAELGWSEVPASIIDPGTEEKQLLLCALHDNLTQRAFNPVEKAIAVERLLACMPGDEVATTYLPLLGLPPTRMCLEETLLLLTLEDEIKQGLVLGMVREKNAIRLAGMSPEDRMSFYGLFSSLQLSAGKQSELMENCADIACRDALTLQDILSSCSIAKIVQQEKLTLSQKGDRIRQLIRQKRYPRLSLRQERFSALKKKLRLPRRVELTPPPFFEGETYQLQIEFETAGGLAAAAEAVRQAAESQEMKTLLKEQA